MASKLTASQKKSVVLRWAKKEGRKVLWKDSAGIWHAALNAKHVPNYAVEVEEVR